jgi:hypothetical protein
MTLEERCNLVQSRADFTEFLKALCDDLRDNSETWENADLGKFLEALAAWVGDMDGYYASQRKTMPKQPDWKMAADMLMAAKMYE